MTKRTHIRSLLISLVLSSVLIPIVSCGGQEQVVQTVEVPVIVEAPITVEVLVTVLDLLRSMSR